MTGRVAWVWMLTAVAFGLLWLLIEQPPLAEDDEDLEHEEPSRWSLPTWSAGQAPLWMWRRVLLGWVRLLFDPRAWPVAVRLWRERWRGSADE